MPGHVLVRILPDPKLKSGLILPPSAISRMSPFVTGVVAAVGASTPKTPVLEIKRGGAEKVLVPRGIGTYIEIDGHEHRFVHVNEIIMVVPTKENL